MTVTINNVTVTVTQENAHERTEVIGLNGLPRTLGSLAREAATKGGA